MEARVEGITAGSCGPACLSLNTAYVTNHVPGGGPGPPLIATACLWAKEISPAVCGVRSVYVLLVQVPYMIWYTRRYFMLILGDDFEAVDVPWGNTLASAENWGWIQDATPEYPPCTELVDEELTGGYFFAPAQCGPVWPAAEFKAYLTSL